MPLNHVRVPWPALALPILAALYFPLVIASQVPHELLRLGDLIHPVAWTLGVSVAAWLLTYGISRSANKAALASVSAVLAFSSLGWATETVTHSSSVVMGLDPCGLLALLYGISLGAIGVALIGARRNFSATVQYLTTMGTILVAWNTVAVIRAVQQPGRPPARLTRTGIPTKPPRPSSRPDIYLIVLDKYESSAILASHFGFDNTPFETSLRQRGFVMPRSARANYVHTFLALAAMLNLRYLDELEGRFGADNRWELAYPLVENNRLISFLRDRGYRFLNFPAEFGATRQNRFADQQFPDPRDVRPEVYADWVHHTAKPLVGALVCRLLKCDGDAPPYLPGTADLMDWRFHALGSIPKSPQPRFVFAHLLVPHEPYIYARDCAHRRPYWPKDDQGSHAARVRQAYVDQIQCVNRKLLGAIDSIRAMSPVPPVILLQADHGHGRFGHDVPELATVRPEAVVERISVFAAYTLPGVPDDSIADTITPVNAMRLVLRAYFGADLPALPERSFWSSTSHAYRFIPVDPASGRAMMPSATPTSPSSP